MFAKDYPFPAAYEYKSLDNKYFPFLRNRPDHFWKSQTKGADFFPELLRDLIERIFNHDPAKRITIAEIISHKWFTNEDVPDINEV